ncbi:MAG: Gldg family protein [Anaerolineales bacterium]
MRQTLSMTRKELDATFSSPMALIFVGVFLAITLFTFFWVDDFWARGTADVRPLFRWMPALLIFLVAALTMRQWSEEQQTGTLEILLTMPIRLVQLVIGKFLAMLALVAVALLLTIFLPITVDNLGDLDWGPVLGGYLAALLMASAYIAIGLFVSSLTDNQIVSLISTVILAGLLHIIGTQTVTELVSGPIAEVLRGLSTSARFESIERGVVDMRDMLYYVSLTVVFLALNVISVDSQRWSRGARMAPYRLNSQGMVALITLNLFALNLIAAPFAGLRADLTEDQQYSLSDVTVDLLQSVNEPLLLRGYFSEENHPLLQPLVPQVRDMLREYEIAGGDNVDVEIIDPIDDPELEAEANQTYGIRPVPLQTADRAGTSLINVYFDILIRYGDQNATLNFQELIEFDQFGATDFEVRLANLEYDLTSAIQRVVFGFQNIDAVLAGLDEPATLTLYYTPGTLPETYAAAPDTIDQIAQDLADRADGQLRFEAVDINDPAATVDEQFLFDQYGIRPIARDFFGTETYYLHMVLQTGQEAQVIFPQGDFSEQDIRTAIESTLQRTSAGFLQTVGIWRPAAIPQQNAFGQQQPSLAQYRVVGDTLQENYSVQAVDLSGGQVPSNIDVLLVIAPQNMSEFERYAVDQYLMRGGSVFIAAGNYALTQNPNDGSLGLQPVTNGIRDMLAHYGIDVENELVLDTQNEPFPVPRQRQVGGFTVQEVEAIDYPFFVDIRDDGMNQDSPILANMNAITLQWVSPISLDDNANADRNITRLLTSTDDAWTTEEVNIQPNFQQFPTFGFPVADARNDELLAVAVEGSFTSFYSENDPPFAESETDEAETPPPDPFTQPGAQTEPDEETIQALADLGTLEQSPNTARLIVVGSGEFLNDNVFQFSLSFSGERYLNSLQFVQNSVDWFVEDTQLSQLRTRGASVRLLDDLTEEEQTQVEALNYGLALASLALLGVVWRVRKRSEPPMSLVDPAEFDADESKY